MTFWQLAHVAASGEGQGYVVPSGQTHGKFHHRKLCSAYAKPQAPMSSFGGITAVGKRSFPGECKTVKAIK